MPVMLDQVLDVLVPAGDGVYVDGTLGDAGYSMEILRTADACRVIGIDRDPGVIAKWKNADPRLTVIHGCFGEMDELVNGEGFGLVDGVVLDIGVSSMQIDDFARGFSFRGDGPLDMRMDPSGGRKTAADIVNDMDGRDLENIFRKYGQERHSRRVAAAIVKERELKRIETTSRLADIIRAVVPKSKADLQDPATRCFQALRIAVNDELGELVRGLRAAEKILKSGGRLVVVSFHSLEDSIVKDFMFDRSGNRPRGSRHLPESENRKDPAFTLHNRKPLKPSESEIEDNPRSRSARLRYAVRTDYPAVPEAFA